ncbi:hypothetical protein PG991_015138 [Apiospora marii]|uniref:Clr5 domain-containing protein n=1 Tax=Apiospora marii TaxID=335849 RepID=A0ABR1R532_9PEZI
MEPVGATSFTPEQPSICIISITSDARATQHWHSQDNALLYQHLRAAHGAQNSLDLSNGVNGSEMALSAPYQPYPGDSQRSIGQDTMDSQACPDSRDWGRLRDIIQQMYSSRFNNEWADSFAKNKLGGNVQDMRDKGGCLPRKKAKLSTGPKCVGDHYHRLLSMINKDPQSIDSREAFVQYSRASLYELFGHSRREWKVGTVHFVAIQEPSVTLTWSWPELFQLCESISVLSQSGVMSCLSYSLQQLLGAIGPSVIRLDPNLIIYFWKIAMSLKDLNIRGVPEVDTYFYTIFGLYLERIRNSLSAFHPAHALMDFVAWLVGHFRTFTQNKEALSVRHQDVKMWLDTKEPFDARRKVFNEDLRWAYNVSLEAMREMLETTNSSPDSRGETIILGMTTQQAIRDKKSEKSFPGTSIEAEYHYYCRHENPNSQEAVLLQLDYLNALSLRSQQHPEAFAQDLWEKLYAHCSAKKKIAQELGMRLAFATHVYTFVSVTNWLTKRSWRIKKPTGPPIFKTNMEKVIDLLWRVEPEIEKLKLETLREGQCGDNQCCMWAVHFSKMLVMWYKETTLSRRVMGSPPLLLHEKAPFWMVAWTQTNGAKTQTGHPQ